MAGQDQDRTRPLSPSYRTLRGPRLLLRGARQVIANDREPQSALVQNFSREALLFAQQPQQQVLGTDVLVREKRGFVGSVCQHTLALAAQGQVHGSGDLLPDGRVTLNLFPDGFDRCMGPKEPIGERLVFAQEAEQQVLRLDVRRTELAGFVACEEDYSPGLFRVPFKHGPLQELSGMFPPIRALLPASPLCRPSIKLGPNHEDLIGPPLLQTRPSLACCLSRQRPRRHLDRLATLQPENTVTPARKPK